MNSWVVLLTDGCCSSREVMRSLSYNFGIVDYSYKAKNITCNLVSINSESFDEFIVFPKAFINLATCCQPTFSIAFALLPSAFKYLSIFTDILSFSFFDTLFKESDIGTFIWPAISSVTLESAKIPLSLITFTVIELQFTNSMKLTLSEHSFVSVLSKTFICSFSLFNPVLKAALKFGNSSIHLFPNSLRNVVQPFALV